MRSSTFCSIASAAILCGLISSPVYGQLAGGPAPGTHRPDGHHPYDYPAATFPGGPGLGWGYYGLAAGPWIGWPWFNSGATRGFWTNGLSLYGPPIPTYGPTPGVFAQNDMNRTWKHYLLPMQPGFGWVGIYAPSPRPKPVSVSVWPIPNGHLPSSSGFEPVPIHPQDTPQSSPGASLILSVKLPQPTAEVFVDGVRTLQTGTDRVYESPPLDGGKEYRYQVTATWIEGGVKVERTEIARGRPGDVIRLDFTTSHDMKQPASLTR